MAMAIQMRRYEMNPAHINEWLPFFSGLMPLRAAFGFRLLHAYFDGVNNEFTWVVANDGDFDAAEVAWNGSPERAAYFTDAPRFVLALHVSKVDDVTPR